MAQDDQKQGHSLTLVPVFNACFSFDGERLLTVPGHGKVAYLWDVETGKELQRFEGHAETVRAVTFSPDGKQVLTGGGREADLGSFSTDNSARLWDLATGKQIRRFEGHEGYVHTVQFSPDGKRILTAARDSTARVWDVETGQELFVFSGVTYLPPAAALSPDGGTILGLVAGGNRVKLWDAKTGKEKCQIESGSKGFLDCAEFSPNANVVLTASSDGTARTWDAKTGRQVRVFAGHTSYVHHAAFSADGQRIITASADGTVRLWEANTGGEIRRFQNPGPVWQVILSADGKRFFAKWRVDSVPVHSGVSLWDAESGQEIKQLPDDAMVEIVGFSPDGEKFFVIKGGKYIRLWNAETGEAIGQYK